MSLKKMSRARIFGLVTKSMWIGCGQWPMGEEVIKLKVPFFFFFVATSCPSPERHNVDYVSWP